MGRSVQFAPIVGGPTPPIASPVAGSIICAYPVTVPDASATPGTACTVASTVSRDRVAFVAAAAPGPPESLGVNAASARTMTSLPAETCVNRSSNALFIVSVRTNVPATKPTPRTIESAVSASRSLRASRLLRVARSMRSALQRLEPVEDAVGRRLPHLVDDVAVGEEDHAIRVARRRWRRA